jgi:RNA polymerase sigma factor (sigma-70 family)
MAAEADQTRPSLLLRIRDPQDADSWSSFVDLYSPLILRFSRKRGLQEADAADVAQDVLAQVARSIREFTYQPERGRFRDWLGTVVRHRVHRFFKREANRAHGADGDWLDDLPAAEQDSDWSAAFNAHILHEALERAKPHFEDSTWEAFRLAWLEQQPATTAAERLNITVAAVYLAKSRVLKRLREEVMVMADDWPLAPVS